MINLQNNRHAFLVWLVLTVAMAAACFGLVAASGALTTTAQAAEVWTFEACGYYDGWGETQCEQADTEGRPTDVITYEDGSQVSDREWAGFTHSNGQWVSCMPEALCED